MHYNHSEIEKKWQKRWEKEKTFSPDLTGAKRPFYNLMMFPYPSAEGLHVGNMYAFTGADVYGRFQRMRGYDVFEPIGLDGFGIHSENYAIKTGRHPKEHAKISERNFYKQLRLIGNAYDWTKTLETYDPDYYKWTQWLFVKMFKAGLAYRGTANVNWCPSCKTVLADEQVVGEGARLAEDGESRRVCERCGTVVEKREMSSWYFKITKYADRLLTNIEKINWPEKIKIAQRQWIGKSKGLSIKFSILNSQFSIDVWTKFWETVFGTTFLAVAPEYAQEHLLKLAPDDHKKEVANYIKESLNKSEQERKAEKEKTGVFAGIYAVNPANKEKVPVYVADYVLTDVGTGAVMGVPAHDERDFDFAKKYALDIVQVVSYKDKAIDLKVKNAEMAYEGEGKLINSGEFDGMEAWGKGKEKMAEWMVDEGVASWQINYHLRDWLISRQRYWGPPIPMINCPDCGWQPVAEEDLPVVLPEIADFKPKGDGTSPLDNAPDSWKKVKCPNCGKEAERELDVSDTFLDSSWYYLRYPSVNAGNPKLEILNSKQIQNSKSSNSKVLGFRNSDLELPWDPEITRGWLPVDAYIGGAEHAVLHLLYARFVWMMLVDNGFLPKELGDEPFPFLFSHGLIIRDGAKMSKSRGNIVNPDEYIKKYGADALRTYLMFLGPYDAGGDFRDTGIEGMNRFINRVWKLYEDHSNTVLKDEKDSREVLVKMHQTIKKVTEDVEHFRYNTAIAATMEFVNLLYEKVNSEQSTVNSSKTDHRIRCAEWDEALKTLCLLLAPFAPFMTEEIYQRYYSGNTRYQSIHLASWPKYREEFLKVEETTVVVQVNGKVRATFGIRNQEAGIKEKVIMRAKEDPKVAKWLKEKKVRKVIFVPGKVINFVV